MGIARFYRWLSERYPLINENITAENLPEFDNLYLDMNGIIHNCSHNNSGGLMFKDESDVWVEVFKYINRLFHIIKPRKMMYMAVDGCAPRAKMNQQRSRRFRAANDAREGRETALQMGEALPEGGHFDSNCITPGTEFMARLTEHLRFFVCKKLEEDPLWQRCEQIVLSGPEVPGEGEHKIMDYIRIQKAQPNYNPNERHCIYGLDADLIMLALASHEPHFALLREEVTFGRSTTQPMESRLMVRKEKFQLLHIALLREYLEIEFKPPEGKQTSFVYNVERCIDDFILFCVLIGNDFLPHLPFAEIGESGLEELFQCYKLHLEATASEHPWLVHDCGEIAFDQLALFLQRYAERETEQLQDVVDDRSFVLGARRHCGPTNLDDDDDDWQPDFECPPTVEMARAKYYNVKMGMNIQTYEGSQLQRNLFMSYAEGLQWVLYYYYRGPDQASWSWYYPYYYAPMVADFINWDKLSKPNIKFELGRPFLPFQQLMAVLPGASKDLLPKTYQGLFDVKSSPIKDFYPLKFDVDIDGVKVPWGGVTLIPFIDPQRLVSAMGTAEQSNVPLTDSEKKRNGFGTARSFKFDRTARNAVTSTLPKVFRSIPTCHVQWKEFKHAALPNGMKHFPNHVLKGSLTRAPGFPTLHLHPLTVTLDHGVKVFTFESREHSMILHLHPTDMVPKEEALREVLDAPCVKLDYPFCHYGKVVAIYLPHAMLMTGGKTFPRRAHEHEVEVRQMLQEVRRKGIMIEPDPFDGLPAGDRAAGAGPAKGSKGKGKARGEYDRYAMYQQPILEVNLLDSAFFDDEGILQYRFKTEKEWRLLHLTNPEDVWQSEGQKSAGERYAVGTTVICIDDENQCFGHAGHVANYTGDLDQMESSFEAFGSRQAQEDLSYEIQQVIEQHNSSVHWHSIEEVAQLAKLPERIVRQIFGTLNIRSTEKVREDVGMNLIGEPPDGLPLSVPCFSIKTEEGWRFSNMAVKALQEYRKTYPELFQVLKQRNPEQRQDLQSLVVFHNSPDPDYALGKLAKYCMSQSFKQLRLVSGRYMALIPNAIADIVEVIEKYKVNIAAEPPRVERFVGTKKIFMPSDKRPPPELMVTDGDGLLVGQRGIYTKLNGLVAYGAKGTITAVYGEGDMQQIEIVLDDQHLGANELQGRAPSMRGLQIPISSFMPILPYLTLDQCMSSPTNRVRPQKPAAVPASERPPSLLQRLNRPAEESCAGSSKNGGSRAKQQDWQYEEWQQWQEPASGASKAKSHSLNASASEFLPEKASPSSGYSILQSSKQQKATSSSPFARSAAYSAAPSETSIPQPRFGGGFGVPSQGDESQKEDAFTDAFADLLALSSKSSSSSPTASEAPKKSNTLAASTGSRHVQPSKSMASAESTSTKPSQDEDAWTKAFRDLLSLHPTNKPKSSPAPNPEDQEMPTRRWNRQGLG
eukprot:gnl/MRDRNA2_/MRDRNA2_93641_c0_seq1.p1 gnl/MRDRNA2_/MRDRNA2_93641_c0~~gnl/MRDRNA2_/MRDRNA2_93641_c0_seq1.p1  ORF type:complete len:1430 (-),score=307.30 gnl/MRDRNA2_/MRDRNA2_93641_c0_seq1:280-4569(-)